MDRILYQMLLPLLLVSICFGQVGETAKTKNIDWSPVRLSFTDYKILEDNGKVSASVYQATTSPNITYDYRQVSRNSIVLHVNNYFISEKSWIKKEHLDDKGLLRHEQGHFDLSEVYARKLAIAFLRHFFTNSFRKEINELADSILRELDKQQRLYDLESDHGKDVKMQDKWAAMILNSLDTLPAYGNKPIIVSIHK